MHPRANMILFRMHTAKSKHCMRKLETAETSYKETPAYSDVSDSDDERRSGFSVKPIFLLVRLVVRGERRS